MARRPASATAPVGHAAVLHACTLECGAFVGLGALVLDRAIVRSEGMMAAGAVLTSGKVVGTGELCAGNPASLLRELPKNARRYGSTFAATKHST
jgi:carbonic anhydrase/acetyltransferase-like protein (isoleucine patch superfamily)